MKPSLSAYSIQLKSREADTLEEYTEGRFSASLLADFGGDRSDELLPVADY
jgi:hypothetical protein